MRFLFKSNIRLFILSLAFVLSYCSNDKWHQIKIENIDYIQRANEGFIEDFKLPKINAVTGKYKFLNRETTRSFGYLYEITIDSFSNVESRKTFINKIDTVEIDGKMRIWGPTIGFSYKLQINFQFYDSDGFIIHEIEDSCLAETGQINIIQKEQRNITQQIIRSTKEVKSTVFLKDYIQIVK